MNDLTWTCEVCQFPVADDTGYLTVDMDAVAEVEEAQRIWKQAHPDSVSIDQLMTFPDCVPWQVLHKDCDPDLDARSYWYAIERCRTHAHLLARTAHLMEKNWLKVTNWADVIGRQAGQV